MKAKAMSIQILIEPIIVITHEIPPRGSAVMPCCGKTPFERPRTDRITSERERVTCALIEGEQA